MTNFESNEKPSPKKGLLRHLLKSYLNVVCFISIYMAQVQYMYC